MEFNKQLRVYTGFMIVNENMNIHAWIWDNLKPSSHTHRKQNNTIVWIKVKVCVKNGTLRSQPIFFCLNQKLLSGTGFAFSNGIKLFILIIDIKEREETQTLGNKVIFYSRTVKSRRVKPNMAVSME